MTYRLWDQVRVDGRQEFNLAWHIQENLTDQRRNLTIHAFKSAKLTDSNITDRIWAEVNSQVIYMS